MKECPKTTRETTKRFIVSRNAEAYADVLKTMLENWREEASALSGSALDDPLFLTTPAELLHALESFSAVAMKVREGSDLALRKAMAAIRRPPRTVQYRGDLVSLLTRLARFASDQSIVQVRSPEGDWRRWPLSAEHVADVFPCAVGDITRPPSVKNWSASIQLAAPPSAVISLIAVKGSTVGDRLGMIGRQRQAEDVLHLVDRCIAASRARLTPNQAIESSVSAEAHRRRVGLLIGDPRPEPRWRHDEAVDFSHLAVVQEIPGVGDAQSKIEIPWASVLSRHGAPHLVRELLGRMMGQRIHKALQFRRPRPPAEIRLRHSTIIHRGWIEAALRTTGDGDALRTVLEEGLSALLNARSGSFGSNEPFVIYREAPLGAFGRTDRDLNDVEDEVRRLFKARRTFQALGGNTRRISSRDRWILTKRDALTVVGVDFCGQLITEQFLDWHDLGRVTRSF